MNRVAKKLPYGRLLAFSAMAIPISAAALPLGVYLPAIYSQHFGVSLGVLGTIFLIEKIWGTIADPLIGALSDRTCSSIGRRRAWIVAGTGVFGISGLFLFFPVWGVTPVYLGVALFVFYLGWSMIQIPYYAWSSELSDDYHERTRVVSFQTVAGAISLLLILILPAVIDRVRPGDAVLKLAAMGGFIIVSLIPGLFLTLRAFPEREPVERPRHRASLVVTLRVVLGNRLLMRILASDFAVTLGQYIRGSLFLFFVGFYLRLPQWASALFLLQFVFGIVAAPIWAAIGRRRGKHRTAIAGELLQVGINLGLLFILPGQLGLLVILTVAQGLAQGSGNLLLRSMVADVADQQRLETGQDRTAMFFSVFSVSAKAAQAVAVGIALPLVAWLGFDPAGHGNSASALRGLLLVFALGPAAGHLLSALLVYGFPLDEAAYAVIQEQLRSEDVTGPIAVETGPGAGG